MFNWKNALAATCVVGAALTSTACAADPPPPVTWKEHFNEQGSDLGFEDPHVTDEKYQIKMFRNGCILYQTLVGLKEVATLVSRDTTQHQRFSSIPSVDEIRPYLERFGCNK